MAFYDLNKKERVKVVERISDELLQGIVKDDWRKLIQYFSDEDTYIRKTAYLVIGRIDKVHPGLREKIIHMLEEMLGKEDFRIRQTVINAAGEIGMRDFKAVTKFFDVGLFDKHHSARNAVIGSVKKMGQKNPRPVLGWAKKYIHHPDKEIRREICHGIELRGRTHPGDILPLLWELQHDETARVSNTLVHVIGQISYKKGCLPLVISHLGTWENEKVVQKALDEIIDVHDRYKNFSALTQAEARKYIQKNFKKRRIRTI